MEDKIFNVWLAGFWEGEGCIGKYKNQNGCYVEIKQALHSERNVENCMKKIQENFGGHLHIYNPKNKKHRTITDWRLDKSYDVIKFIKTIYPYCQFRKKNLEDALIVFEKQKLKKENMCKSVAKRLNISRSTWYRIRLLANS